MEVVRIDQGAVEIENNCLKSGSVLAAIWMLVLHFEVLPDEEARRNIRGMTAIRLSESNPAPAGGVSGSDGHCGSAEKRPKRQGRAPGKKIEQHTSRSCLKSEYLTLLNTFRMLEDFDHKASGSALEDLPSCKPPKLFNEKELYGRRR